MPINFLDMFAGIGGFRSGLERLGGYECVGYCEIDKYAKQAYDAMYPTEGELYFADARTIDPYTLPDIDLICGGFPCQSFSIAGLRRGFQDDTRGTLFFEIARIAAVKRPPFLLLENVPGLLSHDQGRTFATILGALDELGYDVAWQILNSKDFGVPQSRKRVYIVGYLRERCCGEILSFTNANAASLIQLLGGTEGNRVYSDEGVGITLTSNAGGFGGKTGLYDVALPIKVDTKSGFQLAHPGDSMDKATGKPFLVNGKEVTSEVTFTAEKKDGEITVRFTFDGSKVTKQTDIVVFETLYRDGVEIAAHADIEDGGQTVTLTPPAPPVPQTGDNSNLGFWIGLGAVALGGIIAVVIIRVKSRKDEDDE